MKSFILCGIVLLMLFMPFKSFAETAIVGERLEFIVPGLGDIAGEPNISMRIHFRVEGASINLSYMEYKTNPLAPPPPIIIGAPVFGSGTFPPGSHLASFTYQLPRDASGMPYLPSRRVCFEIWAYFRDARFPAQRIIGDACLETFMRLTNSGTGSRVILP
jgi:hypothetical protein